MNNNNMIVLPIAQVHASKPWLHIVNVFQNGMSIETVKLDNAVQLSEADDTVRWAHYVTIIRNADGEELDRGYSRYNAVATSQHDVTVYNETKKHGWSKRTCLEFLDVKMI